MYYFTYKLYHKEQQKSIVIKKYCFNKKIFLQIVPVSFPVQIAGGIPEQKCAINRTSPPAPHS
jgi:hypothetical protein